MTRLATMAALALSVSGAIFGATTLSRELIVLDRQTGSVLDEFSRIETGAAGFGLSAYSKRQLLDSCFAIMKLPIYKLYPEERRHAFATQCRDNANTIAVTMPTNSVAWIISAMASAELGDIASMNTALVRSQRSAPNEQNIAEIRVDLAENHYAELSAETRDANQRDLALLASSYNGARTIAGRYIKDQAFRERITTVVSSMPADVQKRFLGNVRRAAKQVTQ